MTRYELLLRVEHDCPYTRFSQSIPRAITLHWCSNEKDVLEISTPHDVTQSQLDKNISSLVSSLGARIARNVKIDENHRILVYHHKSSSMKQNINQVIERCNCVEIQPTAYRDGSEWYRVVAFSDVDVMALYEILSQFATVKTVSQDADPDSSISTSVMISSSSILGKLTKKQQNALTTAVALGYFDIPPKTSTESLAEKYGIARTTFEEHLRKAEEKILKSLLPYLEMDQP